MAENVKALRRRLRSIRNTKQITRAMEMVSAAKLRRAQATLLAGRPYATKLRELVTRLVSTSSVNHALMERRPVVRKRWLVVFTADRGLAGAFNAQILKQADVFLQRSDVPTELICIGKKGFDYYRTKRASVRYSVTDLGARLSRRRVQEIAEFLIGAFLQQETDEIVLLYNKFFSMLVYRPQMETLLPLSKDSSEETRAVITGAVTNREYLLEPTAEELLNALLPHFVSSRIYITLAETFTAEHSARMVAMSGATRNCEELTEKLTLRMNKARQAAITKEIIEIVSGAEALKA
ncbi:MAG: ATP synthase F1 subunit gamma [Candidatus Sumerlaeaceae bacterium]|nr:ATP synthase F1 subunit gamma [Candidatus Sumerlaeaceae bacterium]